jgi:TfoX/Sxy family transcriptional regulator of competence genes
MAYDTALAERIKKSLARQENLTEKKMFGGVAFMVNGNMCCGVHKQDLIVRIAPDDTAKALSKAGAKTFDLTGRPMKGWVLVSADACKRDAALKAWVRQALAYAKSLPPK